MEPFELHTPKIFGSERGQYGQAQRFGERYLIQKRLSSGGMAAVFQATAHGPRNLMRTVAIKKPLTELAYEAEIRDLFLEEAEILSRISHPNIVKLLDVVEDGFEIGLVLEYVEGVDLSTLGRMLEQNNRRLGVRECLFIVREVLAALDYVHKLPFGPNRENGLIHSDVSPGNIILGTDGRVKLVDFGVARRKELENVELRGLQGLGGAKLRYRAPEQAMGNEVDARSDLYCLGLVLWELLAGERIYEGCSTGEIHERTLHAYVESIEYYRPDLDVQLVRLLERWLSVNPSERSSSAWDELLKIDELIQGMPFSLLQERVSRVACFAYNELTRAPSAHLADLIMADLVGDRDEDKTSTWSRSSYYFAEDDDLASSIG